MSSPSGKKRITLHQAVALGYAAYPTLFKAVKQGVIPSEKVPNEVNTRGCGWHYMISMDDLDALYGEPKNVVMLREALACVDSASMTLANAIRLGLIPAKQVKAKDGEPFGSLRYEVKASDLDKVYVNLDAITQPSDADVPMGVKRMLRRMSADELDAVAECLEEVRGAKRGAMSEKKKSL